MAPDPEAVAKAERDKHMAEARQQVAGIEAPMGKGRLEGSITRTPSGYRVKPSLFVEDASLHELVGEHLACEIAVGWDAHQHGLDHVYAFLLGDVADPRARLAAIAEKRGMDDLGDDAYADLSVIASVALTNHTTLMRRVRAGKRKTIEAFFARQRPPKSLERLVAAVGSEPTSARYTLGEERLSIVLARELDPALKKKLEADGLRDAPEELNTMKVSRGGWTLRAVALSKDHPLVETSTLTLSASRPAPPIAACN